MATRITAKQKSARRVNIAVARKSRKKGNAGKKAYVEAYKKSRASGASKGWAKREALKAAASKKGGKRWATKKAGAYARGVAKKSYKIKSKSGRKQFAAGYKRSIFGR